MTWRSPVESLVFDSIHHQVKEGGSMNIGRGALAACGVAGLMTLSAAGIAKSQQVPATGPQAQAVDGPLSRTVQQATATFRDVASAESAGYELSSGCVSGPEEGAMGVHYGNPALIEDGELDAAKPEVLVFEPTRNGRLRLAAVEYIVLAEQWDANNDHPPVLGGQHFHFVSAPNRSGLPAYYELHVWAWTRNPNGTFADWNPQVRCDSYIPPQP
jgi:hypothetical protein